jgi:uncharacterized protein (UPF0297 family)
LEQLDNGQLRERLMVAETLMKKLYNRNKELEGYLITRDPVTPSETQDVSNEIPTDMRKREDDLLKELDERQREVERL